MRSATNLEHGGLVVGQNDGLSRDGLDDPRHGQHGVGVQHAVVRFGPTPLSERLKQITKENICDRTMSREHCQLP